MTQRLEDAVRTLWNIDPDLKPVPYSHARESAIVDGLHGLAEHFGKQISFTCIDSRGELAFNLVGAERGEGEYGADLAAVLSLVPRRYGVSSTSAAQEARGNWARLNHFDAERLLKMVGEEFYGIAGPDCAPEPVEEEVDESFSPSP